MRACSAVSLAAIFCLFIIMSGCSEKEAPAPPPPQAASPVAEQPAAAAPSADGAGSQMDKARAIHKEFTMAFSETLPKGDTVDALRERIALADKTRLNSMMARSDMKDSEAAEFLVGFTDLLQRYLDLGARHISTLEEVTRLHDLGKEMQERIAKVPDKEKPQATKEFNAIVDQHNSLVQGRLAEEQKEIEALVKELMELK